MGMSGVDPRMLARLLDQTAGSLLGALDDLSDEELRARPCDLAPALWQVGHVAVTDTNLAIRAGLPARMPDGYPVLFARGTAGDRNLPSREEVIGFFHEANSSLKRLAEGDLDRPAVSPSGTYETAGGGLVYMLFHRGYHFGKIMTLRALLHKPRLLG